MSLSGIRASDSHTAYINDPFFNTVNNIAIRTSVIYTKGCVMISKLFQASVAYADVGKSDIWGSS